MDKNLELMRLISDKHNIWDEVELNYCVVLDEFPHLSNLQKEENHWMQLTDNCYLIQIEDYKKNPLIYGRVSYPLSYTTKRGKTRSYFIHPRRITLIKNDEQEHYYLKPTENLITIVDEKKRDYDEVNMERVFPLKTLSPSRIFNDSNRWRV